MKILSKFKKNVGILFVLVASSFFIYQIRNSWQDVLALNWNFNPWEIAITLILAIGLYFINVCGWYLLLKSQKINISYWRALRIWMFSNLGRFIPGGIWQYGGKIYLSSKEGVKVKNAITVTILEAFFVIWTGSVVSILTAKFGLIKLPLVIEVVLYIFCFLCVLALLFITNKGLVKKFPKISYFELKLIPIIFIAYTLQFVFAGIVLFLVTHATNSFLELNILSFIGIYAISWLAGYITIFAPAGFGVQEASIAGFLSSFMPFSTGLIVSILFRFILLIAEFGTVLFVFFIFDIASKKQKKV